ncbi:MAG TPA: phosphate ABC transporter permease family protein [Desulfoprunum sp.]|nr:phosphate ABC transporter permease family protein [Desulfoprunum sp.]
MDFPALLLVLLVLAVGAYVLGTRKAIAAAAAGGGIRSLHSLPSHYGALAAVTAVLPALCLAIVWQAAQPPVLTALLKASLPAETQAL